MKPRLDRLHTIWRTVSARRPSITGRDLDPASLATTIDELFKAGDRRKLVALFDATDDFSAQPQERVNRGFYRAFRALGDDEHAAQALTRAAGPHNRDAAAVWREARKGTVADARAMFADRVGRFADDSSVADWLACFDVLFDPTVSAEMSLASCPDPPTVHQFERKVADRWRYLSVSGMGWSGSGALYDRLRDHTGTSAVAGESRLIEGRYGLTRLPVGHDHHPLALHLNLRNLFSYNLVGFAPCKDWEDYRHVRNARRSSAGPLGAVIARTSRIALPELLAAAPDEQADVVNRWSPRLLEASTIAHVGRTDTIPILDNVVHVANLGVAEIVPDVLFFAVVRDPRDQFLDMLRSNRGYHGDPQRFVKRFRKVRAVLDAVTDSGSDSIRVVAFERFVHDETYRESMLADVVGDLGGPRKKRRFDPDRSAQNTGIWRHSPEDEAIRHIAAALPEYLVD